MEQLVAIVRLGTYPVAVNKVWKKCDFIFFPKDLIINTQGDKITINVLCMLLQTVSHDLQQCGKSCSVCYAELTLELPEVLNKK